MIAAAGVFASIVAEALAIYVFAEWVGAGYEPGQHPPSWLSLVFASLVAFGLPRAVSRFDFSERTASAAYGVIAFAISYATLRLEYGSDIALWDFGWLAHFLESAEDTARDHADAILGTVVLVGAWARSSYRSTRDVELDLLPRSIAWPFGAVTILVMLGAATGNASEIGRGATAFYGVALFALAASQLAQSGATIGDLRAGGVTATLLGGIAAVTVIGVLLFGIVFGYLGDQFGDALSSAVERTLTVILTPFAWVLEKVFSVLFQNAELTATPETLLRPVGSNEEEPGDGNGYTAVFAFIVRAIALTAFALLLAGVVRLVTTLRRRARLSTSAWNDPGQASSAGPAAQGWRPPWRRAHGSPESASTGAIRLYRRVLDDAAQRGTARRTSETPEEFAPKLADTFHAPVTDDITRAFEDARYAGREPDPRIVAELEARWRSTR